MTQRRDRGGQQGAVSKIQIPENVSEFYSNAMTVGMTPWDIMLFFGSTTIPSSINNIPGVQRLQGEIRIDAVIRMSPQHAKAAMNALQRSVGDFEALFGEIHIPPEAPNANP